MYDIYINHWSEPIFSPDATATIKPSTKKQRCHALLPLTGAGLVPYLYLVIGYLLRLGHYVD